MMLRVVSKAANSPMPRAMTPHSNGQRKFGSSNPSGDIVMGCLVVAAGVGVVAVGTIGMVGLGVGMGIGFFCGKSKKADIKKLENSVVSDAQVKKTNPTP